MKKKVIAIIMSLAMAVAFMPTFAFADQVDDNAAQYNDMKAKVVELVNGVNGLIQKYIQAGDLSFAAEQIHAVKDQVDAVFNAVVDNDDEALLAALNAYGAQLDALIQNGESIVAAADDFYAGLNAQNPEAVANALKGVEAASAQFDALIKAAQDGTLTGDVAAAQVAEAQALLNEALDGLQAALEGEVAAQVEAFIDAAQEWAEVAKEQGLVPEDIDALIAQAQAIAAIVGEYAAMEPDKAIDELVGMAQELYAENEEAIMGYVMEQLGTVYEMFEAGEFDDALAQIGLDKGLIEALLDEAIMYALTGESYASFLEKYNDELQEELNAAETAKQKLQEEVDQFSSDWANAMAVMKTKPAIKKPVSKKKKVTVKWAAPKNVQVSGYQISWKKGKKTLKKTVKNPAAVKAVTKKLKKGKKTTVKVRAFYKMTYKDQSYTFWSKWSKGKKVKVK